MALQEGAELGQVHGVLAVVVLGIASEPAGCRHVGDDQTFEPLLAGICMGCRLSRSHGYRLDSQQLEVLEKGQEQWVPGSKTGDQRLRRLCWDSNRTRELLVADSDRNRTSEK